MSQREHVEQLRSIDAGQARRPADAGSGVQAGQGPARGGVSERGVPTAADPARATAPTSKGSSSRGRDHFQRCAESQDDEGGGQRATAHLAALRRASSLEEAHPLDRQVPRGLAPKARERAQAWYDDLSPREQRFHSRCLERVPPSERPKMLELMQKVDGRRVSDPQQRDALRRLVFDQGRRLTQDQVHFLGKVVLTDAQHKVSAVQREHLVGQGGESSRQVQREAAAYNSDNHRLMFSTDILEHGRGVRREIVSHELTHPLAQHRLQDSSNPTKDRSIVYGLQMRTSFHQVTDRREDRLHTTAVLASLYERQGYAGPEAAGKARHALEDPNEYIASFRSLYTASPQARERLAQLDPGMAQLLQQEATRSVPTDREYLRGLDLSAFERTHGMPAGAMDRFRGFQTDPARRADLTTYLERRAGIRIDGTQGSGTRRPLPSLPGGAPPASGAAGTLVSDREGSGSNGWGAPSSSGGGSSYSPGYDPGSGGSEVPSTDLVAGTSSADVVGSPVSTDLAGVETNPGQLSPGSEPLAANMVDLNADGRVDAQDQHLFEQLRQGDAASDVAHLNPEQMLESVLQGVAEGRPPRETEAATPQPFDKETPETRLLREDRVLAHPPGTSDAAPGPVASLAAPLDRGGIEQAVSQVHAALLSGRPTPSDVESLLRAASQPAGAVRVADALESAVTTVEGPARLMRLLDTAAADVSSARAMSQVLAQVAEAVPDRAVGTMLLVTDAPGGSESLTRLFAASSQDEGGARAVASLLEAGTRTPGAAQGMGELLETLTEPVEGDRSGSQRMARSFADATRHVGGARDVSQGLGQLLEADGGSRAVTRLMSRFTGTREGRRATGEMLRRLTFDRQGAQETGRVLARITTSQAGSRQMLESLARIASTDSGCEAVATVLQRIAEQPAGARFLANAAASEANVGAFTRLFERLDGSESVRDRVDQALDRMAHVGSAVDVGRLAARARHTEALQGLLGRFEGTHEAQPPAAQPSDPVPPVLAEDPFVPRVAPRPPQGREVAPSARPGPHAASAAPVHGVRRVQGETVASERAPTRTRSEAVEGLGSQERAMAPLGLGSAPEPRHLLGFRPADVYAEDTLRKARLCPDCGFRLSTGGTCLRCVAFERRSAGAQRVGEVH